MKVHEYQVQISSNFNIIKVIVYLYFELSLPRKVSKIHAAFPRWTATDKRRRRNVVERGSLLTSAIRRPTSVTKTSACSPHTPDVSMTKGTKSTPAMMSAYLAFLLSSAADAADPASVLLAWTYETAKVLGHVASHARQRPLFHGTCVTPSGRFPPLVHNECGSRVAKVPVLMKARHSRSLSWLCLACRPEPWRQDRPWCPSTVTVEPQTHTWGCTTGAPRRSPAAIRIVALSNFGPALDRGNASSQSPDPGEHAARRRALTTWSVATSRQRFCLNRAALVIPNTL